MMVEVDCFGNQHAQSKKKNEKESRERGEKERQRDSVREKMRWCSYNGKGIKRLGGGNNRTITKTRHM